MAWPSTVTAGTQVLASQFNGIVSALATWGGNVDAGSNSLSNLAGLTFSGTPSVAFPANITVAGTAVLNSTNAARSLIVLDVNGRVAINNRLVLTQDFTSTTATWQLDNSAGLFRLFWQPNISTAGTLVLTADTSNNLTFLSPSQLNFGSNWQSWTPSITGSGSMTVSGVIINGAGYIIIGPIVYFYFNVAFTLGGTAAQTINVTLPTLPVDNHEALAIFPNATALNQQLVGRTDSSAYSLIRPPTGNWSLGTQGFICEGFYRRV